MNSILYIAMPCYNEKEVLEQTAQKVHSKIKELMNSNKIHKDSKILFIDDGSKDNTWEIISRLSEQNDVFVGIKLSRNRGHQNAVLAGLMYAKEFCDACICMDADLQDDINAIDKMVDDFQNGCDIVYGVRSDRTTDTFFKRNTAQGYYKIMKHMGVDLIYNHADYRLMSKRALQALSEYKEVNLFLRGIVPLIGYKYSIVEYERGERLAGESKYPLKKMLALAFDGITSFSVKPIRIITSIGITIFIITIIALAYSLIARVFFYKEIQLSMLICSIWMIGGIQLISVGIIGEYIGKIYTQTKARPRYFIEKTTNDD